MSFESLDLRVELLRAIEESGYTQPTPIQQKAIPPVLNGQDVMAAAQTGTGKTAGFTLPLLQRLAATPAAKAGSVRALVLVPTRELAAQVWSSIQTYGKHLPITSTAIFGGVNINPQTKILRRGVDMLVATPGRLLDHCNQGHLDLSQVEILVLDEADRMLDMGFIPDVRRILSKLPNKRQNLLFSATFSPEIRKLAQGVLHKPIVVEVARTNAAADTVSQVVQMVEQKEKTALLSYIIGSQQWEQVLVFTRTKHGANKLAKLLDRDGISTAAIHGNKSQGARTKALADFKAGKTTALIATDIAARGLDIDLLPHVVNFDLPQVAEDYVHRIGRTGRAGRGGQALSLVSSQEIKLLKAIERLLKQQIKRVEYDSQPPKQAVLAAAS